MAKDREAQVVREKGERLRQLTRGNGRICSPPENSQEQLALEVAMFDTLETSDMIGLGASQRMEAAAKVGILSRRSMRSRQPKRLTLSRRCSVINSPPVHFAAMALYGRATGAQEIGRPDAADTVRFMNAAARQADTFREGALALLKLKTGGKQSVVVQHVHVSDGGQAVITGNVSKGEAGGTTGGGDAK